MRPSVITQVWLCPVHAEEFWVPHGGICPVVGCEQELRVYWAAVEVMETRGRASDLVKDALYCLSVDGSKAVRVDTARERLSKALAALGERRFSGEGAS